MSQVKAPWISARQARHLARWRLIGKIAFWAQHKGKGRDLCERVFGHALKQMLAEARHLPPISVPTDGATRLYVATCERDLLQTIWSVGSLQFWLAEKLPVIFQSDGSMTPETQAMLTAKFPGCRIVGKEEANKIADAKLEKYPLCRVYRQAGPCLFARKLFDAFFHAGNSRILTMDSDILFFRVPDDLLDPLPGPTVLRHHCEPQTDLTACRELMEKFPEISLNLNSGLTLRGPGYLDLDELETIIAWFLDNAEKLGLRPGCDQLVTSVLAGRRGSVQLSHLYSNHPAALRSFGAGLISMHYHSWSRYLFALEGLPLLAQRARAAAKNRVD